MATDNSTPSDPTGPKSPATVSKAVAEANRRWSKANRRQVQAPGETPKVCAEEESTKSPPFYKLTDQSTGFLLSLLSSSVQNNDDLQDDVQYLAMAGKSQCSEDTLDVGAMFSAIDRLLTPAKERHLRTDILSVLKARF